MCRIFIAVHGLKPECLSSSPLSTKGDNRTCLRMCLRRRLEPVRVKGSPQALPSPELACTAAGLVHQNVCTSSRISMAGRCPAGLLPVSLTFPMFLTTVFLTTQSAKPNSAWKEFPGLWWVEGGCWLSPHAQKWSGSNN